MYNKTILFLGAGFSSPAAIPTQNHIIDEMLKPTFSNTLNIELESRKFLYSFIEVGIFLLKMLNAEEVEIIERTKKIIDYLSHLEDIIKNTKNQDEQTILIEEISDSLFKKSVRTAFIESLIDVSEDQHFTELLDDRKYRLLVELKEFVRKTLATSNIKVDLEDIFTIFDKSLMEQENWGKYTYSDLDGVRHSLLRLFTYYFGKGIKNFEHYYLYEPFVEFCKNDVTIITTNWDSIVEKIFRKSELDYNVFSGKNFENKKGINIIKLHGSINWFHCNACGELEITNEESTAEYLFRDKPSVICSNCEMSEPKDKVYLRPEIITPTMFKALDSYLYRSIWKKASEELSSADRIIFIGYSLPIADFEIRYLLKKNIRPNTKIDVVLCDTDRPQEKNYNLSAECRYLTTLSAHCPEFNYNGFAEFFNNENK